MNIHEYQAKQIFASYNIPIQDGITIDDAKDARKAAEKIGGDFWVIKAQIHAGG
ncbi:MAG: succinate--CoA ligase subunit beta, partial [Candidatus Cloacimonetes bacterium]|nr:succinate--CoA ligase subunit beta [Candidatus Cloacimonadota bacterium]